MAEPDFQRFSMLCERLGILADRRERTFEMLVGEYGRPGRHYHNLNHIAHCLGEFDELKKRDCEPENPDAVELAIWLHDVVYDSRSSDNQRKSADQAAGLFPSELSTAARLVHNLIMLTRHEMTPPYLDGRIISDVDLAILGQSAEEFDAYEAAVRREYEWVEEETFWKKRSEILRRFLARERIFHTPPMYEKYESAARNNLARSIQKTR